MSTTINGRKLLNLLKNIYLNGLIEECLLVIKDNIAKSVCVDPTQTILLSCQEKIKMPDTKLGLGNLSLLIRYLENTINKEASGDSIEIEIINNKIHFSGTKYGKFMYLLTEPDLIPTSVKDRKISLKEVRGKYFFKITEEIKSELLYYINLVKPNYITFRLKDGKLSIIGGAKTEHQFRIGGIKVDTKEEISTHIYCTYIVPILNLIDITKENSPTFYTQDKKPFVIEYKDNFWALLPLTEGVGENA